MNNTSSIQLVNYRRQYQYEIWQEEVLKQSGVNCRVMEREKEISIRTKDYPDYLLAKSIIKQRTWKRIVRDETVLGES